MKNSINLYIHIYNNVIIYATNNKEEFINYLDDELIIDKDNLIDKDNVSINDMYDQIQDIYKDIHQLKCVSTILNI